MTIRAILYDAEGHDKEVQLTDGLPDVLNDSRLLWVDLTDLSNPEVAPLLKTFGIDPAALEAQAVLDSKAAHRVTLQHFDKYFCVQAQSVNSEHEALEAEPVLFIVGSNFVISLHPESMQVFNDFVTQNKFHTKLGDLSAATFFSTLLDWLLARYFSAAESLEDLLDELDLSALGSNFDRDFLVKLSVIRKQVSSLRRWLVAHRDVFHALARPDFSKAAEIAPPAHFKLLAERFERAVDAVETTRSLVMGSYELFSTGISQRTNETMRILTFYTVLLGILAVITGVFGMNVQPSFFGTNNMAFAAVVIGMLALSAVAMIVGRHRGWLRRL